MEAPPTVQWALAHRNSRGEHEIVELSGRTTVVLGRSVGCDVILVDPRVSRRHATIQLVEDQHLLRDEGSSNGTFLNGFRLTPERVFVLREGDVIEIGSGLLVYGKKGEIHTPSSSLVSSGSSFPLADLIREGTAALDIEGTESISATVKSVFQDVGRVRGLELALALVVERLQLHGAAIFLEERRRLRLIAAKPTVETVADFEPLVVKALSSGEGQLIHGVGGLEHTSHGKTHVHLVQSVAVAPFRASTAVSGAIAGTRTGDKPLDRLDLARIAAIADAVSRELLVHERARTDTRLGFGG